MEIKLKDAIAVEVFEDYIDKTIYPQVIDARGY